jgi:hypothetical protein
MCARCGCTQCADMFSKLEAWMFPFLLDDKSHYSFGIVAIVFIIIFIRNNSRRCQAGPCSYPTKEGTHDPPRDLCIISFSYSPADARRPGTSHHTQRERSTHGSGKAARNVRERIDATGSAWACIIIMIIIIDEDIFHPRLAIIHPRSYRSPSPSSFR